MKAKLEHEKTEATENLYLHFSVNSAPSGQNFMHPLIEKASGLTDTIIAAAIEVHRDKGPGLIESIYEWLVC
jgi:hypothetical protein